MKKLTKRLITSVLKEAQFDPKTQTILTDVRDAGYYEHRAIEAIREAYCIRVARGYDQSYRNHLVKALQLIVLAIIFADE